MDGKINPAGVLEEARFYQILPLEEEVITHMNTRYSVLHRTMRRMLKHIFLSFVDVYSQITQRDFIFHSEALKQSKLKCARLPNINLSGFNLSGFDFEHANIR